MPWARLFVSSANQANTATRTPKSAVEIARADGRPLSARRPPPRHWITRTVTPTHPPTCRYTNDPGSKECRKCDKGKYKVTLGWGSCESCANGTFAEEAGSSFCPKVRICLPALPSRYPPHTSPGLVQCEAGRYGPEEGLSACILCDIGRANIPTATIEEITGAVGNDSYPPLPTPLSIISGSSMRALRSML